MSKEKNTRALNEGFQPNDLRGGHQPAQSLASGTKKPPTGGSNVARPKEPKKQ